jgi:hypothetical protein
MSFPTDNLRRTSPQGRVVFLLFWIDVFVAFILALLVAAAPLLDSGRDKAHGWERLIGLFARDSTVRQTALAGCIGLAVTAWVFFRSPPGTHTSTSKEPPLPLPPSNVVGA